MIRSIRRATITAVVAIAAAALAWASPALAVEHHPKGIYAPFADCPLSNPATGLCVFAKTESGEFVVGKEAVPIKNAITLQGGVHQLESGALEFIGAEDGNTLSKTPQPVPGGLAGLFRCYEITNFLERIACEIVFENGLTGVNAITELAAPAKSIEFSINNLFSEEGIALGLPVKVRLENAFLGSSCYIGSNSKPIQLPLTTGTTSPPAPNKPIKGSAGELEITEGVITLKNNSLVNNSFAAPGAEGCGGIFAFLLDPLINAKLGIPATAGHNTAILKGTLKSAGAAEVKASE